MSRKYEGQSDDAGVMSMLRWGDGDGEQEGREEENDRGSQRRSKIDECSGESK